MKRSIVVWLVVLVMLVTSLPVYASAASIEILVKPSATQVNVGDTVEYVVTATGEDVVAMQFELRGSEGLSYVPNTGATPKNLAQKLGVPAADWTEISRMFTFYNDIGITMKKGTELLRFTCKAEKVGTHAVTLYELLPYDSNFEYFAPKVNIQPVTVRNGQEQTQPPVTQPPATEPPVTQPPATQPPATEPPVTEPPVTDPEATEPLTEPPVEVTQPATEQDTTDPVTDSTGAVDEPTQEETQTPTEEIPSEQEPAEEKGPSALVWVLLGIVAAAAAGAAVLFYRKKKQS